MQVCQRVYGLDISEETIKFNQEAKEVYSLNNLFLINASVTSIPLKNNSMDYVVPIGRIHHIPEAQKVVDEIYRVLKPGGVFIGMVYYRGFYRYNFYLPRLIKQNSKYHKKTRDDLVREIYDGKGNPYGIVYSKQEFRELCHRFHSFKFRRYNFVASDINEVWREIFPDKFIALALS